jgi:ABC-type nickel/cobalt efflux system permease component RcnA
MVEFMKRSVRQVFAGDSTDYLLASGVLLFAVVAGSLHALTPGHGKSVMAALLVGRRGSKYRDVATIAAAVTITHTAVIFILGIAFLVLDIKYSLASLMPYFVRVSGVLVLLLALSLLWSGLKRWHRHRFAMRHAAAHAAGHAHEHSHDHEHVHEYVQKRPGRWGLFLAGASGGLIPCVDALSLLILSVGVGEVGFGMLLVFSFSIGLAAAIFGLGLLLLAGKAKLESYDRIGTFVAIYAPLFSGGLILILAIALIARA